MVMGALAKMRGVHLAEEEALLRAALVDAGWIVRRAADALGDSPSTVRRAIGRHPDLVDDVAKNGRAPGRPPVTG